MLRTTAARAVPKPSIFLNGPVSRPNIASIVQRSAYRRAAQPLKTSPVLALALQKPVQKSLVRYASSVPHPTRDKDAEARLAAAKISAHPELVSVQSSESNIPGETAAERTEQDVDMMAGIRSDFNTILETFTLRNVPQQAMYVGLAGVIPYLATSLSTVALSFDIQYAAHHGTGLLFDGNTSEQLLHIIEPIQLGYGATIISFLGAIHWGLEWAGFGGYQGYPRYAIGVFATAVAWPTLLLSAEVGLITQFLAFTFLYYTDSRAARAGWAPRWYGIYRFVLTAVVGVSIVASLIGRGQIADLISRPTGPADRMRALRDKQLAELEAEDAENKARAANDDDEEEEGEDGDDE